MVPCILLKSSHHLILPSRDSINLYNEERLLQVRRSFFISVSWIENLWDLSKTTTTFSVCCFFEWSMPWTSSHIHDKKLRSKKTELNRGPSIDIQKWLMPKFFAFWVNLGSDRNSISIRLLKISKPRKRYGLHQFFFAVKFIKWSCFKSQIFLFCGFLQSQRLKIWRELNVDKNWKAVIKNYLRTSSTPGTPIIVFFRYFWYFNTHDLNNFGSLSRILVFLQYFSGIWKWNDPPG